MKGINSDNKANMFWLIFLGWEIALFHLFTAVIQALTIIGIGNAVQNVRLAKFALYVLLISFILYFYSFCLVISIHYCLFIILLLLLL